ncbi:MAG: hypothetical protein ACNI3A_18355 [Desulfovibrio sp.]|uniref:hypothetical protein n=1 Tax=Desulfovibrio sp. 7SRBS1 TaxID=3378064 RepID=UPI003B41F90A
MYLAESELYFLNSLREFSKVRRYRGIMPEWVACSVKCDVERLIEAGYVEYGQGEYKDLAWYATRLDGVRITAKGRACLKEYTA